MFLGASLDPEYFKSKVNLFVALAPVTALNTPEVSTSGYPASWPEIEYLANKFGAYNLFNVNWLEETAIQTFCGVLGDFCSNLVHAITGGNDQIDNMSRLSVFLKDYPAGSGYKNLIYYF